MPTIQSMYLPIPKNWQDFENIVCDALSQRWKSTTLQKNGRPGQKQDGVDIYGPDDIGRPVGIQCKRYKTLLKLKDVTNEIGNADAFKGHLTTLFIATTADYDAPLQQKVRELSDQRVAQGKFAVSLIFWDDIVKGLLLNPAIFRAHYPQIQLTDTNEVSKERLIAALELGYFGAELWESIILVYGEFGQMAQADPDGLIARLRIIEHRALHLLSPDDAEPILTSLKVVRDGCQAVKTSESDWNPVEVHAKRVSSRIQAASSLLSIAESNILDLALQLGRIYHHNDDLPAINVRKLIEQKARAILPVSSAKAIKTRFTSAAKLTAGYNWAPRIYSLMDHEIRYQILS